MPQDYLLPVVLDNPRQDEDVSGTDVTMEQSKFLVRVPMRYRASMVSFNDRHNQSEERGQIGLTRDTVLYQPQKLSAVLEVFELQADFGNSDTIVNEVA